MSLHHICSQLLLLTTKNGYFQQWRSEIDDRRDVFHELEDELQKARSISDRMFKTHNERDFDLDWHKEKAEQLVERWRNVHSQIENRSVRLLSIHHLALILSQNLLM